jgi:hypothetical protein
MYEELNKPALLGFTSLPEISIDNTKKSINPPSRD